jgi:Na+/melibiose symporter-like transporter
MLAVSIERKTFARILTHWRAPSGKEGKTPSLPYPQNLTSTRAEASDGYNNQMTRTIPTALRRLTSDALLFFVTRFTRLFAYSSLSVILVFYLVGLGLSEAQTGLLLSLTLVGDVVVSLFLTTRADRIGRRRMFDCGRCLNGRRRICLRLVPQFSVL